MRIGFLKRRSVIMREFILSTRDSYENGTFVCHLDATHSGCRMIDLVMHSLIWKSRLRLASAQPVVACRPSAHNKSTAQIVTDVVPTNYEIGLFPRYGIWFNESTGH